MTRKEALEIGLKKGDTVKRVRGGSVFTVNVGDTFVVYELTDNYVYDQLGNPHQYEI